MKPIMLLLTASLALAASGASAQQDACSDEYSACIERCTKLSQSLQDGCIATCQSGSDACYVKMWGPRGPALNVAPSGDNGPAAPETDKPRN
jgi:hypothetical protein